MPPAKCFTVSPLWPSPSIGNCLECLQEFAVIRLSNCRIWCLMSVYLLEQKTPRGKIAVFGSMNWTKLFPLKAQFVSVSGSLIMLSPLDYKFYEFYKSTGYIACPFLYPPSLALRLFLYQFLYSCSHQQQTTYDSQYWFLSSFSPLPLTEKK